MTTRPAQKNLRASFWSQLLWSSLLAFPLLGGCQSTPPWPSIDLAQDPQWQLRQGQVIWKTERDTAGLAGEVLVATHPLGEGVVQFIKTPLPWLVAKTARSRWQIEFIPQKRTISGRGTPPTRWLWLHLASALDGRTPEAPLEFRHTEGGGWVLENIKTGASLTGFLSP